MRAAPRDELDEPSALVARRRGLVRRFVPRLDDVSRPELVERALTLVESQTPEAARRAQELLLRTLELVPVDFTWRAALRTAFEAHLLAFYDTEQRSIVVDAALREPARRRVLAHELVHALGDQSFGLGVRLARGSADQQAALLSIAEGDAEVLVEELWNERAADSAATALDRPESDTPESDGSETPLPRVLARALAAAYADGHPLVRRVFDAGGWPAVDALYGEPVPSTHVLFATPGLDASPVLGPLPPATAPAPEFRHVFDDVLGEQALRTILEEWLGGKAAAALAGAWRADRLSLFEHGAESALVWELRVDPARVPALQSVLGSGLGLGTQAARNSPARATTRACRAHRDGGVVGLWRHGDGIGIARVDGVSPRFGCTLLESWEDATTAALDEGSTWVRLASPVPPDPTRRGTTGGRE